MSAINEDDSLGDKHKGICPYCKEKVTPLITADGGLLRDACECPSCKKTIQVCAAWGCEDFAKTGVYVNDVFCPPCFGKLPDSTLGYIKSAALTAAAVLAVVIKMKPKAP